MQIIISPAKKMRVERDSFPCSGLPVFLPQTEQILEALRRLSDAQLKSLWKCTDAIAAQNLERQQTMDLRHGLTPALLSYQGIQYQYMAPHVFSEQALAYVAEHLRILSGFYGVLRPFDGVTPYRLEMQAKLSVAGSRDLYDFWGGCLAEQVLDETACVVNLASKEYSRCIAPHLPPNARFLTCVFGEYQAGKIREKGTLCKMARGEMVRYLAEGQAETPEAMQDFQGLGFHFSPEESGPDTYVFLKT